MKALTIIQPYAHLIATGEKRIENRSWPTSYRGWIAIHAGKAKKYGGEPVAEIADDYGITSADLVFGAVIAVARISHCVRINMSRLDGARWRSIESLGDEFVWMHDHEHAEGPWCWVLEDVRQLSAPVAVNGEQGLWTLRGEVLESVKDQIAVSL